MTREELKEQIDELMQQYASEEIDGDTYAQKMMELTTINVNIKMYIFDHLRMYIFAILPLDRYIFSIDRIFP